MNESDLLLVIGASFSNHTGIHAYSLGRYLESKGQPVLMSGYLGSIGFGYPAARYSPRTARHCCASSRTPNSCSPIDLRRML